MAETALFNSIEQGSNRAVGVLQKIPLSFWRAVVIVCLLLWLCRSVAELIWVVFTPPELSAPQSYALQAAQGAASSRARVDIAQLQSVQIFGEAGDLVLDQETTQIEIVETKIEDDVEKTKLNLKLVGIVAASRQDDSSAVIANGSDQGVYQIDDKMPVGNNVTLAKVLNDRVILNNNGNYEALWLYTEADFKVSYASSSSSNRSNKREGRQQGPEPSIEAKIAPSQIPKSISEVVRFSVHRQEGQMVGFRIRPGKNRDLFEQLGLQANDIVTSVNGIPIDSPQAIREHYQQLKSATSADLAILRGEETLYINVSVDAAVSE